MKLLLIARPVSKQMLSQLNIITKKLSDNELSDDNIIMFLESTDMGKKYIILYDKTDKKAYKLFWKVVSENYLGKYVTYWSEEKLYEIKDNVYTRNEIISKYSDFKNAGSSIFDRKVIFSNLLNAINNAELSKKEKEILKIPEFKNIKDCLKKYDNTICNVHHLLKQRESYISKKILLKIEEITKNGKSFSQVIRDIDNLVASIQNFNEELLVVDKLIQNLLDLKEILNETSKNFLIIGKSISRFKNSELSKEEKRILSEIGKIEAIENGFIEYSDNLLYLIDLDNLDSNDLEEVLEGIGNSIINSITDFDTYIIHKNIGWCQLCSNYIYRSFKLNPILSISDEKKDVSGQYDILKKYLDATDFSFTLPLFAYMIFATNKSLFRSSAKGFAINIKNPYIIGENENLIEYISRLNMNFMSLSVDLKDDFPTDFRKEFKVPSCYTNPLYLRGSKYKLKDFSVFLYKYKVKRKPRKLCFSAKKISKKVKNYKIQRKISDYVLQKDLKSQISYIFFELDNNENDLLNISLMNNIKFGILNTPLPEPSLDKFGFNNIIKEYRSYVEDILSNEVKKSDEEYKGKILKQIHTEFETSDGTISSGIYNFINHLLKSYKREQITVEFICYFDEKIHKLSYKQLEDIGTGFNECNSNDEKMIFCSRFIREYNFYPLFKGYEESFFHKNDSWSEIEDFKETMADIVVERYHELLLNEYIYTKNYIPQYFNNLQSQARKYLKDNLKGKKYDRVQLAHCSFLLAAMISFRNYINDRLSEASDDFNKYFQEFNNIVLQMCCTPLSKNIDNATALSEFSAFLKAEINKNTIVDIESGADSNIGWIDRKKNKIYLKNTRGNNFYDKFKRYLIGRHEYFELSKPDFVRDILESYGIINVRYAKGVKRYDFERKILKDHDKFRVLVLDCELLNI